MGPSSLLVGLVLVQPLLRGPDAEAFLRSADVVGSDSIPVGVTRPERIELSDGTQTIRASWKTVDESKPGITRLADGTAEANFTDSYEYEIAAYELNKLLGLELVPPTVERRIRGRSGAVILWVEDAMTDYDRRQENVTPPDPIRWTRQYAILMLFRNLIYDVDYKNARNILVDDDWHLWAIDSSRAFRLKEELLPAYPVEIYSRSLLERLKALDFETLEPRLSRWLSANRIRALLARRDLIVARADELTAERGEAAVLFP